VQSVSIFGQKVGQRRLFVQIQPTQDAAQASIAGWLADENRTALLLVSEASPKKGAYAVAPRCLHEGHRSIQIVAVGQG
jgi:hypothetical protein